MKILYSGQFLGQGLERAGCDVVPFAPRADLDLDEQVAAMGVEPDVVLMEFMGRSVLPGGIHASRHRLAAYCVDAPLNEFWLAPLMRLFDDVFVDQAPSAESFRERGVRARWLPLCAREEDFRAPAPKEHFVTFVGRVTGHRGKRANVLRQVGSEFDLNVVQGVSAAAMQDLFARSRVVLNENLFSGLTLRVFQALASGSLLLTEAGGAGVDEHFRDGEHLLAYTPETLLPLLRRLRDGGLDAEAVARRGQELCRRLHTSEARAAQVLARLEAAPRRKAPTAKRRLDEARAKYLHAVRFGGSLAGPLGLLADVAAASRGSGAPYLLGCGFLRLGRRAEAVAHLRRARAAGGRSGLLAAMTLVQLGAGTKGVFEALGEAVRLMGSLGLDMARYRPRVAALGTGGSFSHDVYLLFSDALFDLGLVMDLGLPAQSRGDWPDTAYGWAEKAFKAMRSEQSLEAVARCARAMGVEHDALSFFHDAIREGAASDAQIAQAASLAAQRYDPEQAKSMADSLLLRMRRMR